MDKQNIGKDKLPGPNKSDVCFSLSLKELKTAVIKSHCK